MVRFLGPEERRHLHLPDGDRGAVFPRGGRAAGGGSRRRRCPTRDPEAEEREKKRAIALRRAGARGQILRGEPAVAGGCRGARLSAEPRASAPISSAASAIGYARPTANALKEHLAAKGVGQDQMIEAGLLVAGDDIPVSFDRFRDRIIFPITDFRGRIVGFGGRALAPDVPAKYLNSPETELFHKGSLLYNGADGAEGRPRRRHGHRRRGLCRRHPDGRRRLRPHRRAARHGADRAPAADPLADGRRADPLLRRRQRRHPRRPPRRRSGAAASPAGQEPPLRAPPRGPGPGRPHPRRRRARRWPR